MFLPLSLSPLTVVRQNLDLDKPKKPQQLGFFGILLVEFVTGKGIFELVGISVGNGLGFSF